MPRLFGLVFLVTLLFAVHLLANDMSQNTADRIATIRASLHRASTSAEASRIYAKLYKDRANIPRVDTATLIGDPDISMAIRAAWERCRRTPTARSPLEFRTAAHFRFIGFVEGKTRVPVPLSWIEAMVKKPDQKTPSHEAPDAFLSSYGHLELVDNQLNWFLHVPKEIRTTTKNDKLLFARSKQEGALDRRALVTALNKSPTGSYDFLDVLFVQSSMYVCLYTSFGDVGTVLCCEPSSGLVRWTRKVWAVGDENNQKGRTGFGTYRQVMTTNGSWLLIFGNDGSSISAEGFELESGEVVFRFASNDWDPDL